MQLFDLSALTIVENAIHQFLRTEVFLGPMALVILEEMGIPLPVPSNVTLAYLGYEITRGFIPYWLALASMVISILIGSSILYFLSEKFGPRLIDKVGHFLHLDKKKLEVVEEQFRKRGALVVIIGRHIPGFRIPIIFFAGISDMKYSTFLWSTFISVIWWVPLNFYLGFRFGRRTTQLFHDHSWIFFALMSLSMLLTVLFIYLHRKKKSN